MLGCEFDIHGVFLQDLRESLDPVQLPSLLASTLFPDEELLVVATGGEDLSELRVSPPHSVDDTCVPEQLPCKPPFLLRLIRVLIPYLDFLIRGAGG